MIKINLLPFRAARKKENIRRQISVYVLSVILLGVILSAWSFSIFSNVSKLRAEQAKKKKELDSYADVTKKIDTLNKRIASIRSQLNVIRQLERQKTGPVRLLDEIAQAVPKDKLWISSLVEKGMTLTLQGTAIDNDTVALFMTNLTKTEQISSVNLQSARFKPLQSGKIKASDFVLTCRKATQKSAPKKPAPKKKK
jgi:type IV pilus assembly protein PilN